MNDDVTTNSFTVTEEKIALYRKLIALSPVLVYIIRNDN